MNITEKLKINNELFGEKKQKTKTKKQKQGTMNNLDPIIQLIPRILLLKLSVITETFTIGKPDHSPSLNVS